MPGIFSTSGMNLRIPEGALTLHADGSAELSHFELASDFWPHWMALARDGVLAAADRNVEALAAHAQGDDQLKGEKLEAEFRSALSAISAMAFSIDALYASVKEHLPADALDGVGGADTARHQWVLETFRRASRFDNSQSKGAKSIMKTLFSLRDLAVHPPADFRQPAYRDDIDQGVEWRIQAFRHKNAAIGYRETRALAQIVLSGPREKFPDLVEWAAKALDRLPGDLPQS